MIGKTLSIALLSFLTAGTLCAQPSKNPSEAAKSTTSAIPYDLRGVQLGVTLEEFRKSQHPELEDGGQLGKSFADEVVLLCTGYSREKFGRELMRVTKAESAIGVVECEWRLPPNSERYMYSWTDASVNVGGVYSDVLYRFSKNMNNELALRQILVSSSNRSFSDLAKKMVQHFGEPESTSTSQVQNKIGNTFQSTTMIWDNDVSSIHFYQRANRIDKMLLIFTHARLNSLYDSALKANEGAPKL